jgi:hypothetical protein
MLQSVALIRTKESINIIQTRNMRNGRAYPLCGCEKDKGEQWVNRALYIYKYESCVEARYL